MDRVKILGQIPLFKDLTGADLQKLSNIAKEVTFGKGQHVFEEGNTGDSLFAIESGLVRVVKSASVGGEEVATLNSGQHFGEMALIDDGPRSATIEAVEPTTLVQIKRDDLEGLLATDLDLAHRIYKIMAKYLCFRLRQTTKDFATTVEKANMLNSYIFQY
jgi:CRP-like cAMP-binding protein